jgi:transposase
MTAREAAEKFGVSRRTIARVMSEERADYVGRAQERRQRMIGLHRQGLGVRAIARELEVSPALVSARLKEARAAGVDLSPVPDEVVAA